jgi:peptide chain release factor subunit 1
MVTALPGVPSEGAIRDAVQRLARITPGPYHVVSCYLKLEPRDKTRGKYLIKMKNRLRDALASLETQSVDRATREAVTADLERVHRVFDDPAPLRGARGVAIFACTALNLFELLPLPHVHRSRLSIQPVPLIRELIALEEEFGTVLVIAAERRGVRFFEVTAYDVTELPGLALPASRTAKFHGPKQTMRHAGLPGGSLGEYNHHLRIREEKHRLYAAVADRIFQMHSQRPLAGLVFAGIGVDAAAVLPHLHTYVHDLVLGVVKINPKNVTAAEMRDAALALREERERSWERAHAEAAVAGLATGWAVNGVANTLAALERGQVRTLLADGLGDEPGIDDAIEEAFAQRAQVDVLYDEKARRAVDGLAALLRFRA